MRWITLINCVMLKVMRSMSCIVGGAETIFVVTEVAPFESGDTTRTFRGAFIACEDDAAGAVMRGKYCVVHLCGQPWHEDLPRLVTNRDWEGAPDAAAHRVADGMLEFWTRHKPVLRVLDLGAMEGDLRFRDIRTFLLAGATDALTDLAASQDCPGDPRASAGVVVGMLAHVANHQHGLERWGVTHEQLVDTVAGIIRRTIVGVA